MATCKDCLHYEICWYCDNLLDPLHGGVICDSFKPAVDVVEVVRCKDCQYWRGVALGNVCSRCSGIEVKNCTSGDSFCSYGKKRSEEDDEE